MNQYKGIEIIDPIERSIQHELTKSLWQKLCEMRIKIGDKGRINGIFISKSYEQAKALKASFHDWDVSIHKQEENSTQTIQITTPISRLSVEALVELTDVFLIAAAETVTKFDGLEFDVNEIKRLNTPWWKFW
ncbi:hypothetical protein GC098_37730 [Paenibacillus sp. LMG 31458]|uniref:Uncharacterized protein n=1 Tax=Paenibacillus phytorum TaxID=2654977 RepID=A0ABX1Y7W9_9BACL|nr:hypothetical protein [Paenibacillus phytorum]NOU77037.1 hypothetical protein [Paenibacillus phytorum]